jgi:hypothetical protein
MKQAYLAAGLLTLYLPAAGAVDFNTDALKSMQEEGHKIVEQEMGMRAFRLGSGQCLHDSNPGKTGAPVVIRKCDGKASAQKWRIDEQGRLVAMGGNCLTAPNRAGATPKLQACGSATSQQWRLDGKNRLTNGSGQCLQGQKGGAVTTAGCSDAGNQVWQ